MRGSLMARGDHRGRLCSGVEMRGGQSACAAFAAIGDESRPRAWRLYPEIREAMQRYEYEKCLQEPFCS